MNTETKANSQLKCFKVTCVDKFGKTYEVGVMTMDESSARRSAEYSLREGSNIETKAVRVEPTDRI